MGRVIWSPAAIEDVDAIADYIARDSADRAALFVNRIFEAVDRLALAPEAGRPIPELGDPERREILVPPYRVMYRRDNDDVWIVGIVHGARNWPEPPMSR